VSVPERYQPYASPAAGQDRVPAHHRPPNIVYDEYGRPHHVVLGQQVPPPIIVQMPVQQQGLSPELQRLIIVTFLILAVVVVCTAAVCAVVVLVGGTLMGIIGTVSANLPMIGMSLVGVLLAAGWAATKIRRGAKD
jgi:hypothetical protein